jgi:hypothetical protein
VPSDKAGPDCEDFIRSFWPQGPPLRFLINLINLSTAVDLSVAGNSIRGVDFAVYQFCRVSVGQGSFLDTGVFSRFL